MDDATEPIEQVYPIFTHDTDTRQVTIDWGPEGKPETVYASAEAIETFVAHQNDLYRLVRLYQDAMSDMVEEHGAAPVTTPAMLEMQAIEEKLGLL